MPDDVHPRPRGRRVDEDGGGADHPATPREDEDASDRRLVAEGERGGSLAAHAGVINAADGRSKGGNPIWTVMMRPQCRVPVQEEPLLGPSE